MNLSSHDIDFLYFMKIRKRDDATKRSAGVSCFYEGNHKSDVLHRHLLTKSGKDKKGVSQTLSTRTFFLERPRGRARSVINGKANEGAGFPPYVSE